MRVLIHWVRSKLAVPDICSGCGWTMYIMYMQAYVHTCPCEYVYVCIVYTPASAYECETTGAASFRRGGGVRESSSSTGQMLSGAGFAHQTKRESAQNWSVTKTHQWSWSEQASRPSRRTHTYTHTRAQWQSQCTRTWLPTGSFLETSRMFKFITVTLIFAKSTSKSKVNGNYNYNDNKSISHSTRSISRICLCACRKFLQKRPQATQASTPNNNSNSNRVANMAQALPSLSTLAASPSLTHPVCVCRTTCSLCTRSNTDTTKTKTTAKSVWLETEIFMNESSTQNANTVKQAPLTLWPYRGPFISI